MTEYFSLYLWISFLTDIYECNIIFLVCLQPVEKVMKMVERINQKSGKEFDLTYLPACAIKFDKHSMWI